MRNIPDELDAAYGDGDHHRFLAIKIEQMEALHAAAQRVNPRHYVGRELLQQIEMLKACDRAMWQMKEALGYPIPSAVDQKHLKQDAEQHGGMYVAPGAFVKA